MYLSYRGLKYNATPRRIRDIDSLPSQYLYSVRYRGACYRLYRAPEAVYKSKNLKYRGAYVRSQEIDLNQDLSIAALQIETIVRTLQSVGMSEEQASEIVIKQISNRLMSNPHQKKNVVVWGQSLANVETSPVVKTAVNRILISVL